MDRTSAMTTTKNRSNNKKKSTIELMNVMTEQKRLGCHIQNSEEKLKLYLAKRFFRDKEDVGTGLPQW